MILEKSLFFGVVISILSYGLGVYLKGRFKLAILNPLLLSIIFVMLSLLFLDVSFKGYYEGAKYLNYLLTPATVCLAIPLYERLEVLKRNLKAIFLGIFAGVLASAGSILVMAILFNISHNDYITLLPKSITTAIGIGVSEVLGGNVTLTVAAIIVTGILGNIIAEPVCRFFKITNPVAIGIAIGTSAHVVGTVKAMEIGETEGAMSSLSIVVAGLLTVVGASLFAQIVW